MQKVFRKHRNSDKPVLPQGFFGWLSYSWVLIRKNIHVTRPCPQTWLQRRHSIESCLTVFLMKSADFTSIIQSTHNIYMIERSHSMVSIRHQAFLSTTHDRKFSRLKHQCRKLESVYSPFYTLKMLYSFFACHHGPDSNKPSFQCCLYSLYKASKFQIWYQQFLLTSCCSYIHFTSCLLIAKSGNDAASLSSSSLCFWGCCFTAQIFCLSWSWMRFFPKLRDVPIFPIKFGL